MTGNKKPDAGLTPEQFQVCRMKGTEPAFTGLYWDHKEPGLYRCICCGSLLFRSIDKYDSGSGWPSYFKPATENAVKELKDDSHGMHRIEIQCNTCEAHLGHMFTDGPKPTGLRYCINSAALKFDKDLSK